MALLSGTALNKALAEAVKQGDVRRTEMLLKIGADANSSPRELPLIWYAEAPDVLKLLLQHGADIDARWRNRTHLHSAALYDLELVKTLLSLGADPNARETDGETPLFAATHAGRADVAGVLAANGADPNLQNEDGWTALHSAVVGGNYDVAEVLLNAGARVELCDNGGATPLFTAATLYDLWEDDFVGLLIQHHADVNTVRRCDGYRPIHCAAYHGYLDLISRLADAGAEIGAEAFDGATARDIARARGHESVVELLARLERQRAGIDG
ncbi:MAG TPA: ankyrin repeat domain-containing protein [Pirellulaceae bacterium]|nr:ankyrin repeat domain-containing protein [Pirellulaceae bacterium]